MLTSNSVPAPGKSTESKPVCADQGFYVWVVWKGEGGEREDVHVRIGNEASRRADFPELDHLLAEL